MKNCKYCKSEIDAKAKICPNCRKKQGAPKWLVFLLIFLGIIVLASGVGDVADSSNNGGTNSDGTTQPTAKFSYTINDSYSDGYGYYIEGIVTNNKDREYSYVQIEFVCYDSDGNNLGTAIDNTNNLLGNETWKYKAMGLFTDGKVVDHCDFREVSGW